MQEWLLAQDGVVIYLSLFLLLMGGVIGLPIPEDIPLILGGIIIQIGKGDPLLVFLVCYISVVLGDVFIFSIGRYFGPKLFKLRWFDTRETKTKLKRIRLGLERKSVIMIFLARHLFYVRTLTFLSCGALRMRYTRFLIADAIAAVISVPLMLVLGYFAADSYEQMKKFLDEAKYASLLVVVALGIGYFIYKKCQQKEDEEEVAGLPPAELLKDEALEPDQTFKN